MHVVFLTLVDPTGTSGQNIYSRSVATALAEHPEVDLTLVCPAPAGPLPDRLSTAVRGVEQLRRKRSGDIRWHVGVQEQMYRTLSSLHAEDSIDGIVSSLRPALLSPAIFTRWHDVPRIVLVEGLVAQNAAAELSIPGVSVVTNVVGTLNVAGSAAVYTADETTKEWILSLPGQAAETTVFRHGVDDEHFDVRNRDQARRDIAPDLGDTFTVGFVGSFKPYHCLDTLIDAVATEQLADIRVLLVGDGPEFDRIERYAREREVRDRVLLTGFVNHESVPTYMGACDALYGVIDPDRQGSPMKVYEYLACGRPVVVHDSPEFEFVRDRGLGETVSAVTPEAISKALQRLRNCSIERRQAIGDASRKYVIDSGRTWSSLAARIADRLDEVNRA